VLEGKNLLGAKGGRQIGQASTAVVAIPVALLSPSQRLGAQGLPLGIAAFSGLGWQNREERLTV